MGPKNPDQHQPGQPRNFYEDPAIIAEAHGDDMLLHRLVGLAKAEERLAANPNDPLAKEMVAGVKEQILVRRVELGLPIELPPES